MDIDAGPKVMGDDGEFHATDEAVDLSHTPLEAWAALGLFWILGATVFYQFFTRYALNNSASWTEEIARYLLICTVFTAISAAVRRTRHIHVDFLYRMLPPLAGRLLSTLVDLMRIAFFALAVGLTLQMMQKMGNLQMTIIDLPMNIVYSVVLFGFVVMTLRSIWVMKVHWQRGYCVLERPESHMDDR